MDEIPRTVAEIADVYLGNLLYALERCAMALAADGNAEGAAWYRALARALAEARGAAVQSEDRVEIQRDPGPGENSQPAR